MSLWLLMLARWDCPVKRNLSSINPPQHTSSALQCTCAGITSWGDPFTVFVGHSKRQLWGARLKALEMSSLKSLNVSAYYANYQLPTANNIAGAGAGAVEVQSHCWWPKWSGDLKGCNSFYYCSSCWSIVSDYLGIHTFHTRQIVLISALPTARQTSFPKRLRRHVNERIS